MIVWQVETKERNGTALGVRNEKELAMSHVTSAPARTSTDCLLHPRSIAIIGVSANPTALGSRVVINLENAGFKGEVYIVNPKRAELFGRPCVPTPDDLPLGVDCVILSIPRVGVLEALRACARRNVRSAIIFSAGFAETGPEGRREQEEIGRIAHEHNMVIEGPNCLGAVNFVDATPLTYMATDVSRKPERPGIAMVSQSGAMASVLGVSLKTHQLAMSYSVATGNEAANSAEDFIEYLIEDKWTSVLVLLIEQFRQPQKFLKLVRRAKELGKHIVLLHPGRCSAARESAATHTGAMVSDYKVMRTKVEDAGVIFVDTIEELIDVAQLLSLCPALPQGGAAAIAESGAFKGLTLDLCESIGLALPDLGDTSRSSLLAALPEFVPPSNPLDLTGASMNDGDLYRKSLQAFLSDDRYGSVLLGLILADKAGNDLKFPIITSALREIKPQKPVLFAALDEGAEIPRACIREHIEELRSLGVPCFPTSERALRALARVTSFAAKQARKLTGAPLLLPQTPHLTNGTMTEYEGKELLASIGIPVPAGGLATTLQQAHQIAGSIGYPVVLKAQEVTLTHKSDIGGVILNIKDSEALAAGWKQLYENVARARPGLVLDGALVEKMGARGLELIVGAKNDKDWGPVLLVGFGGVLAEAIGDVRLLPPDLPADAIVDELHQLKSAALLKGFRGSPAVDVKTAAELIHRLGAYICSESAIKEIDINPVLVYPEGQGAVALDALIVTKEC
jgi:acyl-CoA synthetase (NDP forming)